MMEKICHFSLLWQQLGNGAIGIFQFVVTGTAILSSKLNQSIVLKRMITLKLSVVERLHQGFVNGALPHLLYGVLAAAGVDGFHQILLDGGPCIPAGTPGSSWFSVRPLTMTT